MSRCRHRAVLALALALVAMAATPGAASANLALGVATPTGTVFRAAAKTSTVMRASLEWREVQHTCKAIHSRTFDWRIPDRLMGVYSEEGISPLFTLVDPPSCAAVNNNHQFQPKPTYVNDFARFAAALAERYGPGGYYFDRNPELNEACCALRRIEIWNEPNLPKTWHDPGPRSYGRFFVRVAERIRQVSNFSREIEILTGGVTGLGGGNWQNNGRDFIEGMYRVNGLKQNAGAIGIHTYAPSARRAVRNVGFVRRTMSRHHDRDPIEISEHGWSTCPIPTRSAYNGKCVTRKEQARKLRALVKGLRAHNERFGVRSFLWFMGQDTASRKSVLRCPKSPKNFFGFFDRAGHPKRSWFTWQRLTHRNGPDSISPVPKLLNCK